MPGLPATVSDARSRLQVVEQPVPRYFFDVHDSGTTRDDSGTEYATLDEVRTTAMRLLPDIARDEIPGGGDRRIFTVLVTDEEGRAVYSAMLNFTGLWLQR